MHSFGNYEPLRREPTGRKGQGRLPRRASGSRDQHREFQLPFSKQGSFFFPASLFLELIISLNICCRETEQARFPLGTLQSVRRLFNYLQTLLAERRVQRDGKESVPSRIAFFSRGKMFQCKEVTRAVKRECASEDWGGGREREKTRQPLWPCDK